MDRILQVSEQTLLADVERRLVDEFPCVAPAVVNTLIREQHAHRDQPDPRLRTAVRGETRPSRTQRQIELGFVLGVLEVRRQIGPPPRRLGAARSIIQMRTGPIWFLL